MHFKRAHCMLLVSGQKDDRRHPLRRQCLEYVEPIHDRHLDVEKHQVGREVQDRFNCGFAVATLADDLDVGELAKP